MEYRNIPAFTTRYEFRKWLEENLYVESECYLFLTRGNVDNEHFWYLDAVEEASVSAGLIAPSG